MIIVIVSIIIVIQKKKNVYLLKEKLIFFPLFFIFNNMRQLTNFFKFLYFNAKKTANIPGQCKKKCHYKENENVTLKLMTFFS